MRVRDARPDDAAQIADLLRTSFAPALAPYIPLMQAGAETFMRNVLTHAAFQPYRHDLVTVDDEDRVVAYADLRDTGDGGAFLYYISVSPEARGQRLAPRLLCDYLRSRPDIDRLELDVFHDNEAAFSMYRRLGFESSGGRNWWVRTPPQPGLSSAAATVTNIPVAAAMQETYGFCELDVVYDGTPRKVGRIGTTASCRSAEDFENDGLLSALMSLMPPVESVFLALDSAAPVPRGGDVLVQAVRLQADTATIRENS